MYDELSEFYPGRRVLVTGGLGFIGLNLCVRLLEMGAEVTILDNFFPTDPTFLPEIVRVHGKIALADIRDSEKVERLVRGQDIIFNLAGKSGAADSNKAPVNDLDVNCRGHLTVLEACRCFNPRVTIVFPSSRLVYGKPRYLPVDEGHPLVPESIYAAHKLVVENYHLIYGRLYGMNTTVLRISNPYGPMQSGEARAYGVANMFIQAAAHGRKITIFGDGSQRRDYIYIDDLVAAFLLAAQVEAARGEIYNIGDAGSISLLGLAELAVSAAGSGEIVNVEWPEDYQSIETGDYISCIDKAQRELGWRPKTKIAEGVAQTILSYQ